MQSSIWDFGTDTLIKCTIEYALPRELRWLHTLRIYFVLSGMLNIRIGMHNYQLNADQVILVNPYELFSVSKSGGTVAVYDLDISAANHSILDVSTLWFDCNSLTTADEGSITVLKSFLARFVKFNESKGADNTLLNVSLYYAILHHLLTFFQVSKPDQHEDNARQMERIEQIARYIDKNYMRALPLDEVAKHFYLSVPYMSKVFKKYFGTTYSDYLTNIRLQNSLQELNRQKHPIEELSIRFGFPNSRSFISSFKKKYGITPGQYRRLNAETPMLSTEAVSGNTDFSHGRGLELFAKYLSEGIAPGESAGGGLLKMRELPVCNANRIGVPLVHTFRKLTSIGKAKDILSADNQRMLKTVQREIGFEFIIFHGILDDEMMVYGENDSGEPELNFSNIDVVIDFLLSINLKPFIELSFMPKDLAKPDAHTMYYNQSVISLPADINKWNALIRGLVLHLSGRYGGSEVAGWPFSLWNAPDSSENIFGLGGVEPYFEFYRETYFTVKQANPSISFCGPSCLTTTAEEGSFLSEFMQLCHEYNCLPSILQYHFYPVSIEILEHGQFSQASGHLTYRSSPDSLKESIAKVQRNISMLPGEIMALYITEWNASISHRELLSDTAFQSAYIVKNVLENYDSTDSLCYWVLSDSIDEVRMTNKLFHGGLGLFTYNGIKKASYQAFRLLSKLGNNKLASGDGYFITRSKAGLQIILYNYHHYSDVYAKGELFDMTFTNRYTPFPNSIRKKYTLPLEGLADERYIISETVLSPQYGSSFDKWVELGAQHLRDEADIDYLQSMSVPRIEKKLIYAENGQASISCTLEPHEVRLIEIYTAYE